MSHLGFACALANAHSSVDVILDTVSDLAWEQYQANLTFARGYAPRSRPSSGRPRVLVTGFNRFGEHRRNASGAIVSRWLDEPEPSSEPARPGCVDHPERQLGVAQRTASLAGVGEVEICAMVLPVVWDLAAVLVLREAEAFAPDLVVMNGIAGAHQPLWIELGALNRARRAADASRLLEPHEPTIVAGAAAALPNRASFSALAAAARGAIAGRPSLAAIAPGALLAPPRASNGYLCNATTYAVGHGLSHPGETFVLLEASHPRGDDHGVAIRPVPDLSRVPRFFIHWPSAIDEPHLDAAVEVLKAIVACQLTTSDAPVGGHEVDADPTAVAIGGETF